MQRTIEWLPYPNLKGNVWMAQQNGASLCVRRNLPHAADNELHFQSSGFVGLINGDARVIADTPMQAMRQVEEYLRAA